MSLQLCPTLQLHEILQARILEWVAMPFSRGSSQPRDWLNHCLLHLLHWQVSSLLLAPSGKPVMHFQFSSVQLSCLTLCNTMNCSMPGLPVHHQLPEPTQTRVHWVDDVFQLSHPLSSPSPPALKLSQHQGLFKWVRSSHQVAKVLEFQLQHQSLQWTPRTDFL